MKKIVIIAEQSDHVSELSSMVKAIFPECKISFVSAGRKKHANKNSKNLSALSCGENDENCPSHQTTRC